MIPSPTPSCRCSWPLLVNFRPATLDVLERATEVLDFEAEMEASAERVYDVMAQTISAHTWVTHLRCVTRYTDPADPESVFDETFSFMTLRIRTIVADRGTRWAASVDASSLPLATEMLEVVDLTPIDTEHCHFRWRVCFDVPWYLRPFYPLVKPFFEHLFASSTQQLAAFVKAHPA